LIFYVGYLDSHEVDGPERLRDELSRLAVLAYILVRAYRLIEVFVGLRSVPVGVYTAVNWSAYIPHI
jgi:hypothetical protein